MPYIESEDASRIYYETFGHPNHRYFKPEKIIISRIYNYGSMVIKPKLRSILEIVGDLSDKNDSTNVVDTTVARYAEDLSNEEVNDCLNELELLGLIKMLQRTRNMKGKKDSESFRLLNITKAGLEELLSN